MDLEMVRVRFLLLTYFYAHVLQTNRKMTLVATSAADAMNKVRLLYGFSDL